MKKAFIALLASFATTTAAMAADSYTADPTHTYPSFEISHLGFSTTRGAFHKAAGKVVLDTAARSGRIDITIDTASINTGLGKRDDHLRGPDFFDVKQFPKASFKSTKVVPDGEAKMKVEGDLTLHGVTKPVSFVVEKTGSVDDPKFGKKTGFHATLVVKRSEFGITYMKGGLGEDVEFMVSIEGNEG